jgi:lipopolysaccharide transport protein LptA
VKIFSAIAIILLIDFVLQAQTNSIATTNSAPQVTHIDSDRADFDLNARTATYLGNVRVTDSQMKLTCQWLVADLPQSGHINHIVAETNVVIDVLQNGQMTHATGDKAVYDYNVQNGVTNEIVTLTGNPEVTSPQMHMLADVITWDRIHNTFSAQNQRGTIENFSGAENTNSPSFGNTNQLSAPTNSRGTIDNIDKVLPATQNAP